MEESACPIDPGNTLQMAVFRDPREVAISTYFFIRGYESVDLDSFVLETLPILCQWITIRFMLFGGYLAKQSVLFWYDEVKADPLKWHYEWSASVGLQLPASAVEAAVDDAVHGKFDFWSKGIDPHPGSKSMKNTNGSFTEKFDDEDTLARANSILRVWLPPLLLVRFGVPLVEPLVG